MASELIAHSTFGLMGYWLRAKKEEQLLISLGPGSAVAEEGKKRGETAKNIGERSKPRGGLGRGKARRSLETCLWCSRPIIPDSGIILWLVKCLNVDRFAGCCWHLKYHGLSSWENIFLFLTTNFGQAIQNSVRDLWHISPSAQRRATNIPVVCCKMKKRIQNIDLFILFCDKLRSHLQSDWRSYKPTFKRHSIIPHLPRLPLRSQIFFFLFPPIRSLVSG